MNDILQRRTVRQFIKFAIVGVSSTIVDWGVFYSLNHFFALFYLIAKAISFVISVINSYTWNRRWTFRSQNQRKIHEFSKFLIVSVIGLVINTYVMYLAVQYLNLRYIFGLIMATAVTMFWNFLANKFWTFRV